MNVLWNTRLLRIFVYNMELKFLANSWQKSLLFFFLYVWWCFAHYFSMENINKVFSYDHQAKQPSQVNIFRFLFHVVDTLRSETSFSILFFLPRATVAIICNPNQSFDFISIFRQIWIAFYSLDCMLQYFDWLSLAVGRWLPLPLPLNCRIAIAFKW